TGKLRGLAVTSAMRSEALPDLPTVGEFVPGYEISAWYGVGAPKGTAARGIDTPSPGGKAVHTHPPGQTRRAWLFCTVLPGSPADFGKLVADETEKWGNVIRALNIRAD